MMAATLLVLSALADSPAPPPAPHQLTLSVGSGAMVYSSPARTQGGVGGGLGLRDTVNGRWLLQADVNGLTGLGSVLAVRLGAGVQRQGSWAPAALVSLTGLFGDQLGFLIPPATVGAVRGPSMALGLTLAPLRFCLEGAHVSLLELTVGVGRDGPGLGKMGGVTLLEVGMAL